MSEFPANLPIVDPRDAAEPVGERARGEGTRVILLVERDLRDQAHRLELVVVVQPVEVDRLLQVGLGPAVVGIEQRGASEARGRGVVVGVAVLEASANDYNFVLGVETG